MKFSYYMAGKIFKVFMLAALLVPAVSQGQSTIPYSRYGLGLLQRAEPAFLKGWGGLSAAYHNPYNFNYYNPASYGYISYTTLEAGLYGSLLTLKTPSDSNGYFGDGGLANLSLGFPVIRNKLGVSTGIIPFSRVNYNVVQNNDSLEGLGQTYNYFQGSGGSYIFYLGAGYKWKDLSFGINAGYMFGKLDYSTVLAFPPEQNAFNTLRDESRVLGDIVFNGGVQYRLTLDAEKNYFLDMGVSGNLKSNINATRNLQYVRFIYDVDGSQIPKDTISSSTEEDGEIVLPPSINGGLIFTKANRYMVGLNYQYAMWSEYASFGETDETTDSWRLSAGVQIVPDFKSYSNYWKLIAYRAGFSVGTNYLKFGGKDIPEYELSIGAGFPVRKMLSEISAAAEWTHIGSMKENPLTISHFRLTVGVTLNDRWFIKRKFD